MELMVQKLTDREDKNYNGIDLAKFICSVLVVAIHFAPFGTYDSYELNQYIDFWVQNFLCRIAVPIFFVSSGFFLFKKMSLHCIHYSLIRSYLFRILRLYLIWSAIYFPLSMYLIINTERDIVKAFVTYGRNFIFIGSFMQLWYLNALLVAVSIVSLLLYCKISPKVILFISFVFYFVGLFAQSWFGFIMPIRSHYPDLWEVLKSLETLILTTRNGLFEGFLFVSIGLCIAFYPVKIKHSYAGFCISFALMFVEVFILHSLDFIRAYDMYLFMVPATYFGFSIIRDMGLKDNAIYATLRVLSSLVFYIHGWTGTVTRKILENVNESISHSFLGFLIIIAVTLFFANVIMAVSHNSRLKWIKNLYG